MEKIKEIFEENKITIVSCLTILILSFFMYNLIITIKKKYVEII